MTHQDKFSFALDRILEFEGSDYVPDDMGSPAKFGIRQKSLDAWHKLHMISDVPATVDKLTREHAGTLYKGMYWDRVRGDDLPPALGLAAFDAAVQFGPERAVQMLQRALGGLDPDGRVGSLTLGAAAMEQDHLGIVRNMNEQRRQVYERNPRASEFMRGWLDRMAKVEGFATDLLAPPLTAPTGRGRPGEVPLDVQAPTGRGRPAIPEPPPLTTAVPELAPDREGRNVARPLPLAPVDALPGKVEESPDERLARTGLNIDPADLRADPLLNEGIEGPVERPTAWDQIIAGAELEMLPIIAARTLARGRDPFDPNFNFQDHMLPGEELLAEHFTQANSSNDMRRIRQEIDRERQWRQIIGEGPLPAIFAYGPGVLADPTTWFLPGSSLLFKAGALARGARGAAVVGGNVAATELARSAMQHERTPEEMAWAVAFGGLFGGALTATLGRATAPGSVAAIEGAVQDMAKATRVVFPDSTAGAASVAREPWTTELANSFGVAEFVAKARGLASPALELMASPFPTVRATVMRLVDTGLITKGAVAGLADEVALHTLVKRHNAVLVEAEKFIKEQYRSYRTSGGTERFAAFREKVGWAMSRGDMDAIPQVQEVARILRRTIINPYRDEAAALKLFQGDEGIKGTAKSYITRIYNNPLIQARYTDFRDRVVVPYLRSVYDKPQAVPTGEPVTSFRTRRGDVFASRVDGKAVRTTRTRKTPGGGFGPEGRMAAGPREVVSEESGQTVFASQKDLAKLRIGEGERLVVAGDEMYVVRQGAPKKTPADDLVPAMRVGDEIWKGKKGDLHGDVYDRYTDAIEKAPRSEHVQLESGFYSKLQKKFLTREEARAQLGAGDTPGTAEGLIGAQKRTAGKAGKWEPAGERIAIAHEPKRGMRPVELREPGRAGKATAFGAHEIGARITKVERPTRLVEQRLEDAEVQAMASEIIDSILRMPAGRVAGDIKLPVPKTRGPTKERTFGISDEALGEFLNRDISDVLGRYVRTMASDIEMQRKFGSLDLADEINKINDEKAIALKAIKPGPKAEAESNAIIEESRRQQALIQSLASLVRGVGEPQLPWARKLDRVLTAGRTITYMHSLGSVLFAQLTDAGKVVFEEGFTKAIGPLMVDMARGFRGLKMAKREANLAGAGLEMDMGVTMRNMFDIGDKYAAETKFERALSVGGHMFGFINLMNPWIAGMKSWVAGVAQTRILDTVEALAQGGEASERALRKLAQGGISRQEAGLIAAEAKHWEQVGLVRIPNTMRWGNQEAREAFRNALLRDVDHTVITPGPGDAPVWTSSSIGKSVFQFKRFASASVTRTMLAGLQARDTQTLNGILAMAGFGYLGTILRDLASEGEVRDRAPGEWATTVVDKSGIVGLFSELDYLAANLTGGRATLQRIGASDEQRRRLEARGIFRSTGTQLAGPIASYLSDIEFAVENTLRGDFTQSDAERDLRLAPGSNLLGVNALLKALIQSSALPEKQRKGRDAPTLP